MFDAKMIGQRIKMIRGQQSQQEFAELLNIGRASLARYELGDRPPDLEFAYKTYVMCGVNPLWLMTGQAEQSPLASEEQLLLSRFRTSPQMVRDAALRVVLGAIIHPDPPQNGISGNNNQGNSTGQNNNYNAVDTNKSFDVSGSGNRVAYGSYNEVGKKR